MRRKDMLAQSRRRKYQPLENEKHEMFARCVGAGNLPVICYLGVGYEKNVEAAEMLAAQPEIRAQAEAWHAILRPVRAKRYKHPV